MKSIRCWLGYHRYKGDFDFTIGAAGLTFRVRPGLVCIRCGERAPHEGAEREAPHPSPRGDGGLSPASEEQLERLKLELREFREEQRAYLEAGIGTREEQLDTRQ